MAGNKAAKDAKKAQGVALSAAGQAYTPINVMGPGGAGVTFGTGSSSSGSSAGIPAGEPIPGTPYFSDGSGGKVTADGLEVVAGTRGRVKRTNISDATVSAGDLEALRAQLAQSATGLGTQIGMDPATQALMQNFQGAAGVFGDAGLGVLGQLQNQGMFGQNMALQQLGQSGGFSNQLMGQAMGAFGALPGTQEAATQAAYQRMSELAQPGIERDIAEHENRQFARGQMGTTGGALQTEAFARGLGQADTARQLAAMQEGRAAQTAQLGLGQGLASQGDALAANAMNRFGSMTQLNQALGLDRFQRSSSLADQNFLRAGQLLQNAPQMFNQQLMNSQLGNIGGMLQNVSGINTNALNMANFAQTLMSNQASARGGQSAMAMQMAQPDFSQANMFSQLAGGLGSLAAQGGIANPFSGMFGKKAATSPFGGVSSDGRQLQGPPIA
jgi:hypothetical protein